MVYSDYPGQFGSYTTGAGDNNLYETVQTMNYLAANVFATYDNTFKKNHNLKVMAGFNWEQYNRKNLEATGYDLITDELSDFNLITTTRQPVLGGGQTVYALAGFFGRVNYDYKGRYLLEVSGRYDGTSRFAEGHRFLSVLTKHRFFYVQRKSYGIKKINLLIHSYCITKPIRNSTVSKKIYIKIEKAKSLFRDMMLQANAEFGFEANDIPLMIEAIPMPNDCIVLIITKVSDPEELDTRFSKFSPSNTDVLEPVAEHKKTISVEGADEVLDLFKRMMEQHLKGFEENQKRISCRFEFFV